MRRLQIFFEYSQLYAFSANLQMIELIFKFAIFRTLFWLISENEQISRRICTFENEGEYSKKPCSRKWQPLLFALSEEYLMCYMDLIGAFSLVCLY